MRPIALLLSTLAAQAVWASSVAASDRVEPWQGVGSSLERIYAWPSVLFHASAAIATPPLVYGVDGPLQRYLQREDPFGDDIGAIALTAGGLTPIVIPGALYLGGRAAGDDRLATAGSALLQAEVIQAVVVTSLKWLTDRTGPLPDGDPRARRWSYGLLRDSDDPTDFDWNPFTLAGGLRWPSGHTASNVTLVSTLTAFYPGRAWIPLVGYPLCLVVAVGMLEGDYHWLSDVVAGALIGHIIGWAVGSRFREVYERRTAGGETSAPAQPAAATLPLFRLAGSF